MCEKREEIEREEGHEMNGHRVDDKREREKGPDRAERGGGLEPGIRKTRQKKGGQKKRGRRITRVTGHGVTEKELSRVRPEREVWKRCARCGSGRPNRRPGQERPQEKGVGGVESTCRNRRARRATKSLQGK